MTRRRGWLSVVVLVALVAWIGVVVLGEAGHALDASGPVTPLPHHVSGHLVHPYGFPAWVRVQHWITVLLIVVLARSGIQILADHPRLYWNVHSTPGSEWVRFTRVRDLPVDHVWTGKDDARPVPAWAGLPGGRHTVGLGRHWHFVSALFFILNGAVFVALTFATGYWRRLVPTSWDVLTDAWRTTLRYLQLQFHRDPDTYYYGFNGLQELSYFAVIFVLAPLQILTGLAMSPALTNSRKLFARLFGNRQIARSLHFLVFVAFAGFVVAHVVMVFITYAGQNMNHMVTGSDDTGLLGLWIGLGIIAAIVLLNVVANVVSHRKAGLVQRLAQMLSAPLVDPLEHQTPRITYSDDDVSPYLWNNGRWPTAEPWVEHVRDRFEGFRLVVRGRVARPTTLSIAELEALGRSEQITQHDCIQGWSGVAQWAGTPLRAICDLVEPDADTRYVVFRSFGEGADGGEYYDVHSLEDVLHPMSILAWEMNHARLAVLHGAPLRLRIENELGFKQVKWVREIEFVHDYATIGRGQGGYNEDHDFYGVKAGI